MLGHGNHMTVSSVTPSSTRLPCSPPPISTATMAAPAANAPHFNPTLIRELARLHAVSRAHSHLTSSTSAPSSTIAAAASPSYEADLQAATTALRRLIIDEELTISTLAPQLASPASDASRSRRHQRAQVVANRETFATTGYLPSASSPLNLLLGYRAVQRSIGCNAARIPRARAELADARRELAHAETTLAELRALGDALEGRVQELERGGGGPHADGVAELRAKLRDTRRKSARTMKALQAFFGTALKARLEIEELGGPIAECADVDVDAKKAVGRAGAGGQITLEQAFRARKKRRARHAKNAEEEESEEEDVDDEMRGLLELLMNKSLEADAYVELEMESAVARFLVRAKVAELHPRDARRIRLVGFGGAFEE